MNQVRKHFKCFRCDYHNNVTVPQYFKGKNAKDVTHLTISITFQIIKEEDKIIITI